MSTQIVTPELYEMYLNNLVSSIEKIVGTGEINAMNILVICVNLMQLVEGYPKVTGQQKKELVLKAMTQVLQNKGGDLGLMSLIPSYIDNAVSFDRGEIKISINAEEAVGCCLALCSSVKTK